MAKRWRKQKSGQQQGKRRKAMKGVGDSSSASGTLGGFRRFTRRLVGQGGPAKPKTTAGRIVDIALWVAVAVAAYFVVARQCMR